MCGIAGVHRFRGPAVESKLARRIFEILRHRGPDGQGFLGRNGSGEIQVVHQADEVEPCQTLLVHLRLSILDLSEAGFQPMRSADGRYWMVFNGEIYNYRELRVELEGLGHHFVGHSDSEVLLAAYVQWGVSVFERFVGMFAVAILDTQHNKLTLARDFFGIKPLYFACGPEFFAFASEMKALLEFPDVSRRVNPQRAYDFLRLGFTDHGEQTLLAGVQQLGPGSYVEIDLSRSQAPVPKVFWNLQERARAHTLNYSKAEAIERFRELFLESVDLHLRSDVPVGACLSGGLDSSSIVCAMRQLVGDSLDLHTFTFVAKEDARINEDRWATLVGDAARTTMHRTYFDAEKLTEDFERLIYVQDEPFSSTSIYAQYLVFRLIGQNNIKVVLDGQGADELFGGYGQMLGARMASMLRCGQFLRAFRFVNSSRDRLTPFQLVAYCGDYLLPSWLQGPFRRLVGRELTPAWLDQGWLRSQGVQTAPYRNFSGPEVLKAQLLQCFSGSLRTLLRTEDRSSMAFSIESRVPFLTPKLFEFLLSLPEDYLLADDGTSKYLLRHGLRGIAPDVILNRRDKIGFATPEQEWLAGPAKSWVESILASPECRDIPLFRHELITAVDKRDLRYVWRWVIFILWARTFRVTF